MQPEQLIRLECLRLAAAVTDGPNGTMARARAYADFVRGTDNAAAAAPVPAQTGKPQDKTPPRR